MSHRCEYHEWSDTWLYICAGCGREFRDAIVEADLNARSPPIRSGARNSKEKD
jgi:hypothetical protein